MREVPRGPIIEGGDSLGAVPAETGQVTEPIRVAVGNEQFELAHRISRAGIPYVDLVRIREKVRPPQSASS